ncbi:MAG TPA: hypothetical protein VMK53_05700 [Gemmatimonadales bacterium]|nr:hypothetical protein [Gemmatimonadales bacterium]
MMRYKHLALALVLVGAGPLAAQSAVPVAAPIDSVSLEGVYRAAAVVDSVFVDGLSRYGEIAPGDFGAYLLVRLGVEPFPEDLAWRVQAEQDIIFIRGRFKDIPEESRALFGNLLMFMDSTTTLEVEVRMAPAGAALARFRLTRVLVNRVPIPEFLLSQILYSVGRQYPALTETGRDLYLQIPADGRITLWPGKIVVERGGGER